MSRKTVIIHSDNSFAMMRQLRDTLEAHSDGEVVRRAQILYELIGGDLPPDDPQFKKIRSQVILSPKTQARLQKLMAEFTISQSMAIRRVLYAYDASRARLFAHCPPRDND